MNLTKEDNKLLEELCLQHGVSLDKVLQLLKIVQEYEFKERRAGIYEALRDVMKSSQSDLVSVK